MHRFSHPLDPAQRGPMMSLIRGDMHYIRNGDGVEELYDIRADPAEENNLRPVAEMQAQLSHLRATVTTIRRPRVTTIEPIRR